MSFISKILCNNKTQYINVSLIILSVFVLIIVFTKFTTSGSFKELNDISEKISFSTEDRNNNDRNNNETKHIVFNSNNNGFLKVPEYGQISNYIFPNSSRGPSGPKCDTINYFNSNKNTINRASEEFELYSIIIIVIYAILLILSLIIFGYNSIYCNSTETSKKKLLAFALSWSIILILVIFISIQFKNVKNQREDLNNININDIFGNPDCDRVQVQI